MMFSMSEWETCGVKLETRFCVGTHVTSCEFYMVASRRQKYVLALGLGCEVHSGYIYSQGRFLGSRPLLFRSSCLNVCQILSGAVSEEVRHRSVEVRGEAKNGKGKMYIIVLSADPGEIS